MGFILLGCALYFVLLFSLRFLCVLCVSAVLFSAADITAETQRTQRKRREQSTKYKEQSSFLRFRWRPEISIRNESGSGRVVFLRGPAGKDIVSRLFGSLDYNITIFTASCDRYLALQIGSIDFYPSCSQPIQNSLIRMPITIPGA